MSGKLLATFGKTLRGWGKSVDKVGAGLQGTLAYTEHLNPSTRVVNFDNHQPKINASSYVAPNASVIGDVQVGEGVSIWYGATIRGDVNTIKIGDYSSIGDKTMVHAAKIANDFPVSIGKSVVIGSNAVIHACKLEDECMIGNGAKVLDGATVERRAVVAPGAVVTQGKVVKSGELWSGVPAKKERNLTTEEIELIAFKVDELHELSRVHAEEAAKSFEQLEAEKEIRKYGSASVASEAHDYRRGLIFESQQEQSRQ